MDRLAPWRAVEFNSHIDLDSVFTLCEFMPMEEHAAFIEKLGDTGAVASALSQNETTVSMWKRRGVPWRWRPAMADLASTSDVAVPDGFLDPSASRAVA